MLRVQSRNLNEPTLLDVAAHVENITARMLAMARNIDDVAVFCEDVWLDEIRNAIRRARDLAIVERSWTAA
jgi:hypothetical protein